MPSANIFDFVPQEGIPGVDTDPLEMSSVDAIVFNEGNQVDQPTPNRVPIKAQGSLPFQPDALSAAFGNSPLFQSATELLGTLNLPPEQLLQALNQSFLSSLFGNT